MFPNKRWSIIERLVAEILDYVDKFGQAELAALRNIQKDFKRLTQLDYAHHLREQLDRQEVLALLAEARSRVWPHIGLQQMKPQSPEFLAQLSSSVGVDFQAQPYEGTIGLGLRGFYLRRGMHRLKRPLIYVNTAHDSVAVASTFCHEVGHHLSTAIFGSCKEPAQFFFHAGYEDHLKDPLELAADVLVSVAGYPREVATRIFGDPARGGASQKLANLKFAKVLDHVRNNSPLDFSANISADHKLQYLAGIIHYAKLRWALLAEYNI